MKLTQLLPSVISNMLEESPPSEEFFREALQNTWHTPDQAVISQSAYVRVFEYGDCMQGMPRNNVFNGSPTISGVAYTEERFDMWKYVMGQGTFPIATRMRTEIPIPRARIRGQLFTVPSPHLNLIDTYRQNGVNFERKRVRVLLPDLIPENRIGACEAFRQRGGTFIPITPNLRKTIHDHHSVEAYMYVGKPEAWRNKIDWDNKFYACRDGANFCPVGLFPDNNPQFNQHYYFTKDDFKKADKTCYMILRNGNNGVQRQDNSETHSVSTLP